MAVDAAFNKRSLKGTDYVYVWVDGIHLKVRLEQDNICLLVMIGVRADGTKEPIALVDGHRESTESWADLLRGCKRQGMTAPVLAVGDTSPPSPLCGCGSGSPRDPARGRPAWRWRSSSSSPPKPGGGP